MQIYFQNQVSETYLYQPVAKNKSCSWNIDIGLDKIVLKIDFIDFSYIYGPHIKSSQIFKNMPQKCTWVEEVRQGSRNMMPFCPPPHHPSERTGDRIYPPYSWFSELPNHQLYLLLEMHKNNCKSYPKCEYVGKTTRPFRIRLAEHKQYIRSQNLENPSGHHFNLPGHQQSHLSGLVLEHVKSSDPFVLKAR